jgi:cytochrome c556
MKATILATGTALALALAGTAALADGHFEKEIKARKAVMQLRGFNLGQLGAMAKGKMAYDAETASVAAANLLATAKFDMSRMWPKGSDSTAMKGKTRAKVELWNDQPEVSAKAKALVEAATAMAAAAGNGLDAVKSNIGDVGKSCNGCHDAFREKK